MGRTEGATHRMIDEGGARWRDFAHDVVDGADHQGRDALAFNHMRDETDGLMTEGSIGNQQRQIHLGLLQVKGEGRRELVFDLLVPPHTAHEG